jgi:hypothetical protein
VKSHLKTVKALGAFVMTVGAMSSASALTLDTTFLQADSVFKLSQDALDAMTVAKTSMGALGNSFAVSTTDGIPAFDLPINKVDVSLGLPPFSPLVSPNWGGASGSALGITRGSQNVYLANFVVDYSKDLVMADITSNGVTAKDASLFSFTPTSDLQIGLNGLTLNMHQTLANLTMTSSAVATFASGLKLSAPLQAAVASLNWGTITIDINGAFREPINPTPFTVTSAVPELPSTAMMLFGLVGIAAVSRRQKS